MPRASRAGTSSRPNAPQRRGALHEEQEPVPARPARSVEVGPAEDALPGRFERPVLLGVEDRVISLDEIDGVVVRSVAGTVRRGEDSHHLHVLPGFAQARTVQVAEPAGAEEAGGVREVPFDGVRVPVDRSMPHGRSPYP
jgi:hypothetical protein